MKRTLLSAVILSLFTGLSHAAAVKPAKATLASGVARQFAQPSVRAQDDFYVHTNGKWLETTQIPADKSAWGSFVKLEDEVQPLLLAIIEACAKSAARPGAVAAAPDARKIGDFYASFMDEKTIEQRGLAPLAPTLAKVAALQDKAQLPALIAELGRLGVSLPYEYAIHQDAKESTRYVADIVQGGLGMPDRDYYLNAGDARLAATAARYAEHIERLLSLAGNQAAAADARIIVAFETALARLQWSAVDNRNPAKTYNKVAIAKLAELAPGHDWKSYLNTAGISAKIDYVIVSQPSYLTGFADLVDKTPIATLRAYLQFRLLSSYARFLTKPIAAERFAFAGTVVHGITDMQPRWKRGVGEVEEALGESIGKLYVEKHFPAERKARVEAIVKNLLAAFKASIDTLDWMSPETRQQAQVKLAKFKYKIGYPNKWKDYAGLTVVRDDLVGNVMRSRALEAARSLNKLGQPIDRDEWGMTPQTVNAYYQPEMNEVVFPAAILQPPFFDAKAEDAVNYGAIGAVIGHEISHGFDDQGSQYDGDGSLRNWWTDADQKNFKARTAVLVSQYGAYSPLPGYPVNGELTLGENIADNAGLAIAYKAYQLALGGKPSPVLDGMTGDQRFFTGWGQVWRIKMREAQQIALIKMDNHSPSEFRVNGTLKNQPQFYDAFQVEPGDKLYLAPKDRVRIW